MFKVSARTVLELGSELISSDIIAFYELVKNAIDAGSKSGAEIKFDIVQRRNVYVRLRTEAETWLANGKRAETESVALANLIAATLRQIEPGAAKELVAAFSAIVSSSKSITSYVTNLDEAYRTLNTITISDTGSGMALGDLQKNFLTIGTPSRKVEVEKAITEKSKAAPYLGEKGIGRLSAMRLGHRLRVETATEKDARLNVLVIDWNAFDVLDAMVEDIKIEPEKGPPKALRDWSGTRIQIGDLSEDWTAARVKQFADFDFARLTDPFEDPKRRPRILIVYNGDRVAIPWMDRVLVQSAHAHFRGVYTVKGGKPSLQVEMEATNLGYEHPREVDVDVLDGANLESAVSGLLETVPVSALESLGPFTFEAYWYNRRLLTSIDELSRNEVRELQKKWSGILLFRDGFRVFPYGDDEDDWLGLDRRALGRSGYSLNKNQFVGRVQISRTLNPMLVDQTNREGLRETPEQTAFVAIIGHVVQSTLWDFFRSIDRKYKEQKIDLGDVRNEIGTLERRANSALTKVRRLASKASEEDKSAVDDLQHAFVEFRDLAERAQRRIEEIEAEGQQLVHMAGVGLIVEVVAHELARATETSLQALDGLKGGDLPSAIRARLETLRAEMKTVSKRLRVLDELSVSGRQRAEVFDLGTLIDDLKEAHTAQFLRHGISFEVEKPKGPLRVRVVKGMVVQILENLLSNSVYWLKLKAARGTSFSPKVQVRIAMNPPTIYFSDNGSGIAVEHKEKVFRPFWSLKDKSKRRGLGLYVALENASQLKGTLTLSDKADRATGRLHEFVLELPEGVEAK